MRNLFVKTYAAFAVLILVSFTFAGSVFLAQIGRSSVVQKKSQLETTVSNVQSLIERDPKIYKKKERAESLSVYLQQMAENSSCQILIADDEGNIEIRADEDGGEIAKDSKTSDQTMGTLSEDLTSRLNSKDEFFDLGNLNGLFSENYYIAGRRCEDSSGKTIALVIAAASSTDTMGLMSDVMHSYVIIIFITLILTLILSWFLTSFLTRPLKGMVQAVKQFTRGDFDVRVAEENNCDEIDELAESFNTMISTMRQQEELSRNFVANVSHELKTPMTSISGFADGMLDGTIPPEKHQQYLEIISQESHRLSRMVLRMLETARIESGEMVITPVPFDLSETAIQVLLSFEKQLEEKKIDVDVELKDFLTANGDRDLIYRVVYNLIDNAVKFVNEGGKLTIRSEVQGKMAYFSIRNTGSSIPEEDLPHVFDRFYKVDRSRSMDRTGAGLGLYFVKSIVILHGGDISVRSNNNETEFSFTIPAVLKQPTNNNNLPGLTQN